MAACSWMVETAQLGEGEVGQKRFSGDVTSAGKSWLQDILSPNGLHMLPECCSLSLERWLVLLNKIQIFGFLSEVSLPICLFSLQQMSSAEHPSGLAWAGVCLHLTAPAVPSTSIMLSVLLLRTLLIMYLITNNYLWQKNIEGSEVQVWLLR